MNEVQAIVDLLAVELGRPVGVDDRQFRAIAYSSHQRDVDPVRRASIMGREAPHMVVDWLRALGVQGATEAIRIPANASLGMVARVCLPLRFRDWLLGFLWLIDDDQTADEALRLSNRRAQELVTALARNRAREVAERDAEAAAVQRAIKNSLPALAELARGPCYTAVVVDAGVSSQPEPGIVEVVVAEAVGRARRSMSPRHLLADIGLERAILLLTTSNIDELEHQVMALASGLQRESATLREHVPRIGVGGTQHLVAGLPESYSQAAVAVRMAQMVKRLGSVVLWDRTGALGLVARMLDGRDPHPLLPRCVRDLLADPDGRSLLETVETYLRHGGDVRVSAEALHLHRASLYKRLRRVERIAGIDLSCGPERLELHLGLQLWRLGGA